MDILIHYIIPFVGMLVALIVIHELGHYITAKLFGIKASDRSTFVWSEENDPTIGYQATVLVYCTSGIALTAYIAWRWRAHIWHRSATANTR